MNISSPKNSITKTIGLSNGKTTSSNNKGGAKASGQVTKSTETTTGDANVAKEEATTWEPGKPVSKDADRVAADTTKALYKGYWDFKRAELDHQRGLQKDQLDFKKQQAAQQNFPIGQALVGAVSQMASALLGQSKGGGGSSGGGSAGGSGSL